MLTLKCSRCAQVLKVGDDLVGRRCKCSKCGAVLQVPGPAATIASVPAAAPRPADASLQDTVGPSHPGAPANPEANGGVDLSAYLKPAEGPNELGRLGPYRVTGLLGTGGMGVVLQAEDARLGRSVALKIMQPTMAAARELRERFLQEARIAAAVEHDHIITIYQVDEDRGLPYIAMPLLRGESLEARLRRQAGPQPIPFVVRVGLEIATGLEAAHAAGLIHRDIKPANIWLEAGRDRVKILDFGLARVIHGASELTKSGAVLGTPGYLAPEQVGGQTIDTACDRFSLGAVLYRMCTGKLPFQGTDTLSMIAALAMTTPLPVAELNPRVPPRLADLIMRMLAREPKARPSDREVIETLQSLLQPGGESPGGGGTVHTEPPDGVTQQLTLPKPKRAIPIAVWLAAGAVGAFIALLLVVGIGIAVVHSLRPKPAVVDETPEPPIAVTKPPPTETEDALASVQDSVRRKQFSRMTPLGFPIAQDFDEIPAQGALLIGLEVGLSKFFDKEVIHSIRPIFLTEKGELQGTLRTSNNKPAERVIIMKAKPGYAVAEMTVDSRLLIEGLRLTYHRIGRERLTTADSYQSDWVGNGRGGQTLAARGAYVIGINGKTGNDGRCVALGLVTTYVKQ